MSYKKIATIMMLGLLVGALSAAPAQAGLGGCGKSMVKARAGTTDANPFVDALRWVVPGNTLDFVRALLQAKGSGSGSHGNAQTEGLGGCFWGLGGCKL